jgi:hypothetical protein
MSSSCAAGWQLLPLRSSEGKSGGGFQAEYVSRSKIQCDLGVVLTDGEKVLKALMKMVVVPTIPVVPPRASWILAGDERDIEAIEA